MLVVMLLLLIVTATATFAVHSTTIELRASGYARQRMQTRYIAEAALTSAMTMVEMQGPESLSISIERSESGSVTARARRLAAEEPEMAGNVGNSRVTLADFTGAGGLQGPPIDTTGGRESYGRGMGFAPDFAVDVNDHYVFFGAIPGQRSDGGGELQYVAATYTARGRTIVAGGATDAYSPATLTVPLTARRGFHETVTNARAIGISGPTRRR